ncbi:MAG: hypothetical protein AB1305_04305 [Candidatus Hadarchaeota archaeon]
MQQPAPTRTITLNDLLNMPGVFLGLAAILVMAGSAAMSYFEGVLYALLVMAGSAVLSVVRIGIPALNSLLPVGGVSTASGMFLIIVFGGAIGRGVNAWQNWIMVVSGFICLFAAFLTLRARK